jgi:hypothetical protein
MLLSPADLPFLITGFAYLPVDDTVVEDIRYQTGILETGICT